MTKEEAVRGATEALSSVLRTYHKRTPVLLLVSGGSAFHLLDGVPASVLGPQVTIGVLDERYSADPAINNFSQLTQTHFYTYAARAGCASIDTRVQKGETQDRLRDRFEKALKIWKHAHPKGKIIITQGMGADGHTAGIFPGVKETEAWVASNPLRFRVTTTLKFLKECVDVSIFFACGKEKRETLQHVFAPEGSLETTPARIIHSMRDVHLFTDQPISV